MIPMTSKFVRKPFPVDAVRVTHENMLSVARWCNGAIMNDRKNSYIKVGNETHKDPRWGMAHVGDWVVSTEKKFRAYNNASFVKTFESAIHREI